MATNKWYTTILTILVLFVASCAPPVAPTAGGSGAAMRAGEAAALVPAAQCVEFSGYADNTKMGLTFSIAGFGFTGLGTMEPFVNDIAPGVHGLQFDQAGIHIDLPQSPSSVTVTAGSYTSEPLEITALDSGGSVLDRTTIAGDNSIHTIRLSGQNIRSVVLKGGQNEGVLVDLCIGNGQTRCVGFESLALGTTYHVGDTFSDSGVTITAKEFEWGNGTLTPDGFAEVANSGQSGGSGQEMIVNNINLAFTFGSSVTALSLRFGEYGGNLNIETNGNFSNFANFVDLNGTAIGGATVAVTNGTGNDQGTLQLSGAIGSFAIGGQELFIDELCTEGGGSTDKGRVTVRRSDGGQFISNEDWTEIPYYGSRGTFFADVTGDGLADAIVVNDDTVTVRRSDGGRFTPNEDWTMGPYYGSRGTFFADVTGDGLADAIVVNDDTVTVRRSDGGRFTPNEDWTMGPYYGSRGTFFADVTGDGLADAIVVNE